MWLPSHHGRRGFARILGTAAMTVCSCGRAMAQQLDEKAAAALIVDSAAIRDVTGYFRVAVAALQAARGPVGCRTRRHKRDSPDRAYLSSYRPPVDSSNLELLRGNRSRQCWGQLEWRCQAAASRISSKRMRHRG